MTDQPRLPLADWSVDKVVYEFCYNEAPPWVLQGLKPIPNKVQLESTLRANDVDGSLLTELQYEELKNELDIKSLGQRKAVEKALRFLRGEGQPSATPAPLSLYTKDQKLHDGIPTPDVSRYSPYAPSPAWQSIDGGGPRINERNFTDTTLVPSMETPTQFGIDRSLSGHFNDLIQPRAPSVPQNLEQFDTRRAPASLTHRATPENQPSPTTHYNSLAVNAGSQNNPTISLIKNEQSTNNPGVANILDTLDAAIDQSLRPAEEQRSNTTKVDRQPGGEDVQAVKTKPKRRIAPDFVRHIQTPLNSSTAAAPSGEQNDLRPYLSKDILSMQDTFDVDGSDSDQEFIILNAPSPTGTSLVINRRLKRFWHQKASAVDPVASDAFYKLQYPPKAFYGPLSEPQVTLLGQDAIPPVQKLSGCPDIEPFPQNAKRQASKSKTSPDTIVAVGHGANIAQSGHADADAEKEQELSRAFYTYLLEKYPVTSVEDDVLPTYGESGDENDFDDETWQEIEDEMQEQEAKSSFLTYEQAKTAVHLAVDVIREVWRLRKLPKVQLKAYRLWMKLARVKNREAALKPYEEHISHKQGLLGKMTEIIATDRWSKVEDVNSQCDALEETVFAIMEDDYTLQVLKQNTPPEKPEAQPVKRQAREKPALPADEENLDSGSDIDSEEQMTDFVVEDEDTSMLDDPRDSEFGPSIRTGPAKRAADTPSMAQSEASSRIDSTAPETGLQKELLVAVEMQDQQQSTAEAPRPSDFDTHSIHDDADAESDGREDRFPSPSQKVKTPKKNKNHKPRRPIKSERESTSSPRQSYSDDENSDLDARPPLPQSKYKGLGHTRQSPIELTSSPALPEYDSTEGNISIATPPLNPAFLDSDDEPVPSYRRTLKFLGSRFATEQKLRTPSPATDTDLADRVSSLETALRSLSTIEEKQLSLLMSFLPPKATPFDKSLGALLSDGLVAISRNGIFHIKGCRESQNVTARWMTKLFMSFVMKKDLVRTDESQADINQTFAQRTSFDKEFEREVSQSLWLFDKGKLFADAPQQHKAVNKDIRGKKRKHAEAGFTDSAGTGTEDSDLLDLDSIDEEVQRRTPHKKRKKKIAESQEAKSVQKSDQARIREVEYRRQMLFEKMEQFITDTSASVIINSMEPPVLLDVHIAGRAKPHQVQGIQFLWREIVEDPRHQGCLLAHTMGLGKTMQVISLLVSIAQCSASRDPDIVNHLPKKLQQNKTLVLCPPSLIENWFDELLMWSPPKDQGVLGEIYRVTGRAAATDEYIETWAENGGVLIISYDTLRSLVTPAKTSKQEHLDKISQYEEWLLNTPSLVIADEAHKLKNAKSKISILAQRFKTKSRIALTGSPLNNHLEEYHTMVEWIAPGYLGDLAQFRQKYVDPINAGLYADSSGYERRLCLRKLHTLKKDIEPKVNRADITAIRKDMPPKTEYIITIPLTDAQRRAYDTYVVHLLQQHQARGKTSSQGLFKWMNNLMVLAAHPKCFLDVFEAHNDLHGNSYVSSTEAEDQSEHQVREKLDKFSEAYDPLRTEKVSASDVDAESAAAEVFNEVAKFGSLDDPDLSCRTLITKKLVEKATALGDKTLVFSHSIPTLNYLEQMLREIDPDLMRIDGTTKMSERQKKTKTFNDTSHGDSKVILISTRAGGLGLNLQGANRVIIFDSGFNPMWEEQAVGRAYRLGQTTDVFVYRFKCGGTFEEPIYNKALFKTQLFQRVVDKKNPTRAAAKSVSQYLFQSKDVVKRDFKQFLGRDPNVLDELVDEVDQICNLELTETFQRDDGEELDEEELRLANAEQEDERLRREDPEGWKAKHGLGLGQIPRASSAVGNGVIKNSAVKVKMQPSTKVLDQQVGQAMSQSKNIGVSSLGPEFSRHFDKHFPQGQIDGPIDLGSGSDRPEGCEHQ